MTLNGRYDQSESSVTDQSEVIFVCVATGDFYGMADVYVERMFGMLQRFSPRPFKLVCVSDRSRNLNDKIQLIDCADWHELRSLGGRATRIKLGLFNPAYIPYEEFYYLDLTLIVRSSLKPLLEFSEARHEDLVIVKGWNYDGYNSCVMRICVEPLRFIYDDFISGIQYPGKIPGDQDYITGSVHNHKVLVATFPDEYVVSFKKAIKGGLSSPDDASKRISGSIIVKFHGEPKMHHFFNPILRFFNYGWRYLAKGRIFYPFSISDLKQCWTGKPGWLRSGN